MHDDTDLDFDADAPRMAVVAAAHLRELRPSTYLHSVRVAEIAVTLAQLLRLRADVVREVYWGSILHDIGELAVPASLLDRPGPLDAAEWELVRSHTTRGAEWLDGLLDLGHLVPYARSHHERFDGTGYPDCHGAGRMPLTVAIVGVADSWDGMTTSRPYRDALTTEQAAAEMRAFAGRQWSKAIAELLLAKAASPVP